MSEQAQWILLAAAGINAAALLFLLVDGVVSWARGRRRPVLARPPSPASLADDDPLAALVAAAERADGTRLEGTRGENRLIEDIARWRLRAGGDLLPEAAETRRAGGAAGRA